MRTNSSSSLTLKFELPSLMDVNSPNEKSFSMFA